MTRLLSVLSACVVLSLTAFAQHPCEVPAPTIYREPVALLSSSGIGFCFAPVDTTGVPYRSDWLHLSGEQRAVDQGSGDSGAAVRADRGGRTVLRIPDARPGRRRDHDPGLHGRDGHERPERRDYADPAGQSQEAGERDDYQRRVGRGRAEWKVSVGCWFAWPVRSTLLLGACLSNVNTLRVGRLRWQKRQ